MKKNKRGLGKGLDTLIGIANNSNQFSDGEQETLLILPVNKIKQSIYQPRKNFDVKLLEELAESIKIQGLLQPIIVRAVENESYEIIAGERRWRAVQLLGHKTVQAIIKQIDDKTMMAMAIIENLQREDLNPVEEAMALQRLQHEFDLSQQDIAETVGKPRSTVANTLRLMNLQHDVLQLLERGDIEIGHAKCLLGIEKSMQLSTAKIIVENTLTVRDTEALIKNNQSRPPKKKQKKKDANVQKLERELSEKVGAKVVIQETSKNKGKLVITYNSLDELDGVIKHIN
jgi:ParB family transcriptional regulator, chromosome partitioning protein